MMAGTAPRTGTSWDLIVSNVTIRRVPVTGSDNVTVSYALLHNGAAYQSGSLAWSANNIEDAWSAEFLLPPTPGILVATVTITQGTHIGVISRSIKVVS